MINFSSFHEFGFMSGIWLPKAYSLHLQGKLNSTSSRIGTSPLSIFHLTIQSRTLQIGTRD